MSMSTLSQVLTAFEDTSASLTLSQIARNLDVSAARLEGMIQYWVRKGKLRETVSYTDCGTCGRGNGDCPFAIELPRSYELVTEDSISNPMAASGNTCSHHK